MKNHQTKLNRVHPISGVVVSVALLFMGCTLIVAPQTNDSIVPVTTPVELTVTPAVPASEPSATSGPQEEETTMPATPAESTAPEAATPIEQAKADLAERLSVDVNTIEVVESQSVTWRDGSMGCPEAGMMYAQVLIPGMRILLSVDGQAYEYHSGNNGAPFFCENPEENSTTGA